MLVDKRVVKIKSTYFALNEPSEESFFLLNSFLADIIVVSQFA